MNIEEILAEEARERIREDLRKKEKRCVPIIPICVDRKMPFTIITKRKANHEVMLLLEKPYLNPEEYKDWIEETELKAFKRTIRCPACGSPDLKWDGVTLNFKSLGDSDPWYLHYCPDCSYSVNLQESYPSTVYRPR